MQLGEEQTECAVNVDARDDHVVRNHVAGAAVASTSTHTPSPGRIHGRSKSMAVHWGPAVREHSELHGASPQ